MSVGAAESGVGAGRVGPVGSSELPARAMPGSSGWPAVFVFVGVLTAVRAAVLVAGPAPLGEDEAWYWEWSRRLGLGYATKGPGIAWLIAASAWAFGTAAEWAVRMPAALSGAAAALGVAGLARATLGEPRAMLASAVVYSSMPFLFGASMVMTIDGPLLACWAFGAWAGWCAVTGRGRACWLWFGLAVGVGALFKYTALVLPVGVLLFALVRRGHASVARRWLLAGLAPMALALLPVVVWNAQHDWVSFRHLLGHLGLPGGDVPASASGGGGGWSYSPLWTLEFLALQVVVAGPAVVLIGLGVVNLGRASRGGWASWRAAGPAYLICVAAPVLVMYLVTTLFTRVEANWPTAAYVSLAAVGGWAAVDGWRRVDRPMKALYRASQVTLAAAVLVFAGLAVERAAFWSEPSRGLSAESAGLLPAGRYRGAERLALRVRTLMDGLEAETGREAFVIAVHYGRAAQLAYYLPGRPTVYAASGLFGDGRKTQYDLWPETDLRGDAVTAELSGRPAVLFNGEQRDWARAFDRVVRLGRLEEDPKSDRVAYLGYGFRGFGDPARRAGVAGGE